MLISRFGALAATASLVACTTVSHLPLTPEASAQLQGKSFAVVQHPIADFAAFTAGKAAFAIVGAAAMISEGNDIVKTNDVQDPARSIGKGLAAKLASARGMRHIPDNGSETPSDEVATLAATYPGADFIVDVKTLNWMFNYYPSDWAHYKVTYGARVRIVDSAGKKVVAETMCRTVQGDDKNPPTKDQLLENNATLLKKYLDQAVSGCVEVLSREILRL